MKTNVFLREENIFKEVDITDPNKPEINDKLLSKWQNILNILADLTGVSAALIMKINLDSMEVLLKNQNKDNPYQVGDSETLGSGLYCETVISQNKELFIKNALENEVWKDNPDVELDMISYYGLPINWSDGESFGTICILNNSEIKLTNNQKKIFREFKNIIEEDLDLLLLQEQFQSFFDLSLDLLCIVNSDGKFVKTSKALEDLLGYNSTEMKKKNILDFIHPDDLESTLDAVERLKRDKKADNYINRYQDNKGNYHYFEWNANIYGNYIYASARDITDKVLQNKRIIQQKDRLNFIIEGTDLGTWEWNIQTDETVVNKRWAEIIGYKLEELKTTALKPITIKIWENFTHPDDLKIAYKALEKHFNGETNQYNVEIRMKHKDGHWVWINDRGRVVSWTEDNKPLKMFGVHIDISLKKEKERKIKESEKRYKAIFNSAPNPILTIDQNGYFQDVNLKALELFGYGKEEFLKLNFRDILDSDNLEKGLEIREKLFISGQVNTETKVLNKNGEKIDIIADAVRLNENRYLVFAKDITERNNQREKLKFQLKFNKTLAEISSSLLEINSSNIDRKMDQALAKIGEFFDVDRSYIFKIFNNNKFLSNTYEWSRNGVKSEKESLQNFPTSNLPWLMGQLTENKFISIPNVDKLEKKAEVEKKIFKEQNIKSLIALPIYIEKKLFGFFGFDSVKEKRTFTEEEKRLLNIFTDVITSAFSRHIYDKKVRKLTYKDSLTGLYNRRFFEEELKRLDTTRQLPISIIVADINGLKIINDSLGHKKGDQLIEKSAEVLNEVTREEDILARTGGDEFAILLPKTEKKIAEKIINRIKKESKKLRNSELTVTMALGIAVKTDPKQNIEERLRAADNNMYQNKLSNSRSTKSKIVRSLLTTLEIKSNETKNHAIRMTKLAVEFGEELGLNNSELNRLSLLSTLHDIGKTTIAEEILKKPGKLTDEEWELIKNHPERGYKIANSSEEFALIAEEIYAHHERWDGSGYPRGLKAGDIPYLARIISIIDSYDVMTNDRSYCKAISKKEALKEIKSCAGSQFDPDLAETFIKMIEEE